MAKVANHGPLSSNGLHFEGGPSKLTSALKRKTPSELRGEQLKRANVAEFVDESLTNEIDFQKTSTGVKCGFQKPDSSKIPKYVDTRMDALYPARKNSTRLRLLSKKEELKGPNVVEHSSSTKSCSTPSDFALPTIRQNSRKDSIASNTGTGSSMVRVCKTTEKIGDSKFLSVKELSSGGENLSGRETVDLDKALKGLIREAHSVFGSSPDAIGKIGDITPGKCFSEFQVNGLKIPLDFTLKTTMRVVSSSSVNWFHRLVSSGANGGLPQFSGDQRENHVDLHSWVYPQSSLPPSVISALSLSSAGGVQMDFLKNRQSAWDDAFRNIYYMFRKKICDMFYVCTSQFVVMFVGDAKKEGGTQCHAYVSQSTRNLRSMLRENDVHYTMPLCQSKIEQTTTEDLVELSEMEKNNLGQIRRQASMSDVDNTTQSLLAFSGNENVHGLYDFLLNSRFLLTSLSGVDVPVLYAPVPFQNASLSSPEVKCKEVKTVDCISISVNEYNKKDETDNGFYNSIEIKDSYLPPWVISNVCEALCAKGMSFDASFVTESTSTGLNVGLGSFCPESNPQAMSSKEGPGMYSSFIPNTTISPNLRSTYLKSLKFNNGSYNASVSPV